MCDLLNVPSFSPLNLCIRAHARICVCVCVRARAILCAYVCARVCTCLFVFVYVLVGVLMCVWLACLFLSACTPVTEHENRFFSGRRVPVVLWIRLRYRINPSGNVFPSRQCLVIKIACVKLIQKWEIHATATSWNVNNYRFTAFMCVGCTCTRSHTRTRSFSLSLSLSLSLSVCLSVCLSLSLSHRRAHHAHTHTHARTHTRTHTHIHTHAHTHTHSQTHVHARTRTHTHTHARTRTHTHTHTHPDEAVTSDMTDFPLQEAHPTERLRCASGPSAQGLQPSVSRRIRGKTSSLWTLLSRCTPLWPLACVM